jgi:hypothetical protein
MPFCEFLDFLLIFQINCARGGSNKTARNGIHLGCSSRLRYLGNRRALDRVPFS